MGFGGATKFFVTGKSNLENIPSAWSPVHMLLSAAEACFLVTFLSIAEKARIQIASFESEAEGTMDMPDGKHGAITAITIRPKIRLVNETDLPKLANLFEKTEKHCVVGNSLNFKIKIDFNQ